MSASKSRPSPSAGTAAGPQLLTVRDVATIDRVSEKTVRRAIADGLLRVLRVGPGKRLIRIHPEAHAAYRDAISKYTAVLKCPIRTGS